MKNILMITVFATLAAISSKAQAEVYKETMTQKAFVKEMTNYFARLSGVVPGFHGELEDIGGACLVHLTKNERNEPVVELLVDDKTFISIPIDDGKKVYAALDGDDEAYTYEYRFGTFMSYKIVLKHASDAFDTIQLSNSVTTLQCGAYY